MNPAKTIVADIFKAYADRNIEGVLERCSDDVCFHWRAQPEHLAFAGTCQSKSEFLNRLQKLDENFVFQNYSPAMILADGNHVASLADITIERKSDGTSLSLQAGQFWTIRDGKVTDLIEFYDTAQMAEWLAQPH